MEVTYIKADTLRRMAEVLDKDVRIRAFPHNENDLMTADELIDDLNCILNMQGSVYRIDYNQIH